MVKHNIYYILGYNLQRLAFLFFALAVLFGGSAWAQPISTIAGNGAQDSTGVGGLAVNASLNLPASVAGDTSGNIYIADTGNHRILRVSSGDSVYAFAGTGSAGFSTGTATSAQLNAPTGVFADSLGNVYIADTGNHRIRLVVSAGTISTVAGIDTAGFSGDSGAATSAKLNAPQGIFRDGIGNIYIADSGNHRIRKINTSSNISTIAGTGVAGFSGDDTLAVAAQLSSPTGVFVDSSGNIYIADSGNHRIRKITASDSTMSTVAGTGVPGFSGDGDLPTNAQLAFPEAVHLDSSGNIYIADRFNQRIRRVNNSGNITTLVGDGSFAFGGDGSPANFAKLAAPSGIYLDRSGNIFIADSGNHRIRKVIPTDAVGLVDSVVVDPGVEVQILRVPLTGDGLTSVHSLSFTLSDLTVATGLSTDDFVEARLYESPDTLLSSNDTLLGTLAPAALTLGSPVTLIASPQPTPGFSVTQYYLVSVVLSSVATEQHAFKVGFATGGLATSAGNRGFRVLASDTNKVKIDIISTRLVFTVQPSGGISGSSLPVQPVLTALNDSGLVDVDFTDTVTLTSSGAGTLINNTATADSGVVTFSNVTYFAASDDEIFALTADDQASGAEGDLPSVVSDSLSSNTANDPPVVTLDDFSLREDEVLSLPLSSIIADPDDTSFTFTFTSDHIVASVDTNWLTIVSAPDWSGLDTLTIVATDSFGAQGSDKSAIEIRPVNDPPSFLLPDSLIFAEDDTLEIDLTSQITDLDNEFGDFLLSIEPSPNIFSSFDPTGILRLWLPPATAGSGSVQFTVWDPNFAVDRHTLALEILTVNDPPQFALPDTSLLQGSSLILDLSTFTSDEDHALSAITWSADTSASIAVSISAAGLATLQPSADFFGIDTLAFSATDAGGISTSDTIAVEVIRVNQAPVIAAIADTAIVGGDTLTLNLLTLIADPDDPTTTLTLSVSGAAQTQTALDAGLLTVLTPITAVSLVEALQLVAVDPFGLSDTTSFALTILATPPLIANLPDTSFAVNDTLRYPLVSFLDPTVVTLQAQSDSGLVALINPLSQVVTLHALDGWKGTTTLVLSANDSAGRITADTIQVSVLNIPPVVSNLPNLFLEAGTQTQLDLDSTAYTRDDEPLANLTWSSITNAAFLTVDIDPVSHRATIAAADTSGLSTLIFRATDAQGATAADTLLITILVPPPPPRLIANLPDTSFAVDDTLSYPLADFLNPAAITLQALSDSGLVVLIDPLSQIATLYAQDGWKGTTALVFSASDNTSRTTADTIQVSVLNIAPVVGHLPNLFLDAGTQTQLHLDSTAYTRDDEPLTNLTWSSITNAAFLTIDIDPVSHRATIAAATDTSGLSTLIFRATDAQGATAADTLLITILVPPPPPRLIANLPDTSFAVDDTLSYPLADFLNPAATALQALSDSGLVVLIDPLSRVATLHTLDGWKGTTALVFSASDSTDRTTTDTIQVSVLNIPPVVGNLPNLFLDAGTQTQLNLDSTAYTRDDEPLTNLTWSSITNAAFLTIEIDPVSHRATIAATADTSGLSTLIFRATDAQGATAADTLTVTVLAAIDTVVITPPDTTSIDTVVITPPDTTSIDTVVITPPDTTIIDTVVITPPDTTSIDTVVITPPDTTSIDTVVITPPDTTTAENQAPIVGPFTALTVYRDGSHRLVLDRHAQDDQSIADLVWTAISNPGVQVSIDPAKRHAVITPFGSFLGQTQIVFRATDAQDSTATDTLQVTVALPPPGDLDSDGMLSFSDLFRLVDSIGLTSFQVEWDPRHDLNDDGRISFEDLFKFVDLISPPAAQ